MKKIRTILLFFIYAVLLCFTLLMEYLGIREPAMRTVTNIATLGMAAVSAMLFWIVYRIGEKDGGAKKGLQQESVEQIFDKERYLVFANEHGFTRRETEVGLLVANGYSNLRIAEELFISETTVKKHVTHIYDKSGIDGRKAFSAYFLTVKLE